MRKAFTLVLLAVAIMIVAVSCDDPKHEHSYDANVWEKDGTSHWHVCTSCGEKVDVAEHTIEKHDAKAATCTEKGWNAYETCSVCGYTTYKEIEALGHTTEDGQCTRCNDYFYSSVKSMNTNNKRDNILNKTVTVTVGTQKFEESADKFTIGTSALKGTTGDNGKVTFVFKDGDITTNATKYSSIDSDGQPGTHMVVLVPEGSDVTFENVNFHGVVTLGGTFNSITFKNCEFTGTVLGYLSIVDITFDGCTFNKYSNDTVAKSSNPIWFRPALSNHMHSFTFINNEVYGCLPVKLERVGLDQDKEGSNYTPVINVLDNYFDVSYKYEGTATDNLWTDNRNMGFMIRPNVDGSIFTLYDDGNTKSEKTTAIYVVDDDQTECFDSKGIKILDRDGNNKEIKALIFKKTGENETDWITLKSIEESV